MMNSILKFACILAITAILCFGAIAQTSDDSKTKSCCQGQGDKDTCCQSEACQRDETVAAAPATTDGLTPTIACGCCKQGGASVTAPIILALDIDKDGFVSATEIRNATQSLLALDKNQDGKLDRFEMHANSGFSKVNASTKAAATKTRSARTSRLMSGADADYFAQKLLEADTNDNDILEPAEIKPSIQRIMHIIDLNEDGQLSLDELKKIQQSISEYNQGDDPGSGGGDDG
jgi:hypothetical protein